jgi:hypothetical protein
MSRTFFTSTVGAAVALLAFAACSSDSTVAPGGVTDSEITAGIRQDAGEGAVMDVNQYTANEVNDGADVAGGARANVAGTTQFCNGSPDSAGWFHCSAVLENGLTVTRSVRFWEGTSFGLNFNGLTDSVNHIWTADGTINSIVRPGKVWTIARGDTATMTVLRPPTVVVGPIVAGAIHVWNGIGQRDESSTYTQNNVERDFSHIAFDTATDVRFQMPRAANPYPLQGTISRHEMTHFTAGNFSRTVTSLFIVTFDGTHIAQLQDGGVTCDLDLDTRTVSNCH